MSRLANIIISDNIVRLGIDKIKSLDYAPPHSYDGLSIKNTIKILEKFCYKIKLISFYDFNAGNFSDDEIFIVSQYILNRFNEEGDILNEIKSKVNKLINSGNHFILVHHFWPYYIFSDVLDIEYYKNGNKYWFQNKFDLKIIKPHQTLINIDTFLQYNSDSLKSDEFTFLFKEKSKFTTLIQKIPKTKNPKNFISYGYQKNNKSYIFLIDVHNIGEEETHSFYFDMLLNNTLNFIGSLIT